MECRQLLCILCLLELAGFAAGSTTATPSPAGTARDSGRGTASTATAATAATGDSSSAQPTSAAATAGSAATSPTPPELLGQLRSSPPPSAAPTALPGSSPGVPTSRSPPSQPGDSALTSGPPSSAATPEHPAVPAATTALHSSPQPALRAISCHGARDQGDTGAICLQLNESSTCEHFLERKGLDLWQALCENRTHSMELPCEIKLTPSSLDRDCLLLILKGEKDPDKLLNTLQKSHWEKFGIESLKKESTRSRRDPSQRTLIALVTSGLLLAFLGLAGYFLMRRRSWSPAGQRLAEDPYYTENGSQGNTMLMSPSQEPAEPQEKPNLNGGTQENGTGSKNGRSGRQHSPADTEM